MSSLTDNTVPGSGFSVLGAGFEVPGSGSAVQNPQPRTENPEPRTQKVEQRKPHEFWRTLDELAGDPAFRERLYNEFPSQVEAITDETTRRTFMGLLLSNRLSYST